MRLKTKAKLNTGGRALNEGKLTLYSSIASIGGGCL